MSQGRRRRSLRLRLTAIAAAGAAVVLTLGAVVMLVVLTARLDDALSSELGLRADDVEAELGASEVVALGAPLRTQLLDASGGVVLPVGDPAILSADTIASLLDAPSTASDVEIESSGQRVLARRVVDADGTRLILVAGSTRTITAAWRQLLGVLALAGPLVLAGVTASAWFLTGAALSPVRSMTRRAASISVAAETERLPEPGGSDEIAELASTLNGMLDRITSSIQHERTFIDNASHELRTPLAVLRGELELLGGELRRSGVDDVAIAGVESALEETDRLTQLAEHLLVLARIDAGTGLRSNEDLVSPLGLIVEDVVRRVGPPALVTIEIAVSDDIEVRIDSAALDRVVTNLIANAVRFARSSISVRAERAGALTEVVVEDDGPGFPDVILRRPFDRFVRADPERQGTGLGLAIVQAIIGSAHGTVSLGNDGPSGGARVTFRLPNAFPTAD